MVERLRLAWFRWGLRTAIGLLWWGRKTRGLSVSDERVAVAGGRIRLRVYCPQGEAPFPVILYFHGGGWIAGDLDTHDAVCRDLCAHARHLVVAVDYRRAPEHPFPIPIEDCLFSLQWVKEHAARLGGDPGHLTLCGDSAGGNLAAVVAQQARQTHPGLIKGQILVYPVTDHCRHAHWPSYAAYGGRGYSLPLKGMMEMWDLYLRGSPLWTPGMRRHDLATPLHTCDLTGLSRTLLILAEQDLLHDEGAEYARLLRQSGVAVEVREYPGTQHGFFGFKPSPAYRQAIGDVAAWVRAA
ncbi:acetyl esterase [Fontimonas thermophila]|uniref:Acetyl esterase n=1 Tax=Fontimonas thermophila TaxID=1076937 RepID=A0A1I2KH73_9GAMM|nr:alpha/beta hydrolase [Fontimonas thermophila]SFF65580.1 acetyl esterase [Fontimonas thermophila]